MSEERNQIFRTKAALHFADSLSGLLKRATEETQKIKGARKLEVCKLCINCRLIFNENTKGQLISKCLFCFFNSPKKRTKTIRLEVPYLKFFVRFLGELKIPKRYSEIN